MGDTETKDERTDPWVYTLNRGLAQLVPLSLGYWLSVPITDIFHRLWRSKREAATRNHARILARPPDDPLVEQMAHRTFRHFGRYIVELLSVQGWSLDVMRERIDIEGDEHFDEARAYGKGVIFTSAHMGSIEVAGTLALVKGFKITSVAERLEPKMLRDWVMACRAKMGIELLPSSRSGMTLVRRLRRGEMVALIVDMGVSGGDGLWSEVPVSNHREELSIALSEDDGKSFTKPTVIARQRGGWLSYPRIFENRPGELWLTTMQGGLRLRLSEADLKG